MSRITLVRVAVATLIVAMLGGAYLIVASNDAARRGTPQETPSGFFH